MFFTLGIKLVKLSLIVLCKCVLIFEAIQSPYSVLIRLKAQASIEKSMKKKTAQDVFDKDEVQSDGDNMDDGFVLC